MNPETFTPPTFAGEYVHGVDNKGRVTIPSEWRFKLEGEPYWVVTDSTNTHLLIMPPNEFEAIANSAATNPNFTPGMRTIFLQNFYSRATKVETDKQGRLLLPDTRKQLGMEKEAVLVGVKQWFKLFSKEAWSATKKDQAAQYQEMGQALGV